MSHPENVTPRRDLPRRIWQSPELVCHGSIVDLVKGGGGKSGPSTGDPGDPGKPKGQG
jgi:hypothetical protein